MNACIARILVLLLLTAAALPAQVPRLINYQGRITAGGVNFDGPGQFKFALVDAGGTTSYWSNDGTSTAGSEPAAAVTLTVTNGQYSVLLGDTSLANMAVIPESVFNNSDLFVRVWFNDGANGSQLLTPDQHIQTDCATPAADAWQQRDNATPPPAARSGHTAVWTGSEMIVWGGWDGIGSYFNTGGRYDPAVDSWTAMPTTGAPDARAFHTAVWTGSEMIVWGGEGTGGTILNTGGRYHPAGDSWTAVSTTGAPAARSDHTAVWMGSEMIVWGGLDSTGRLNTGGRYHPAGDSWTAVSTTGAPTARSAHTAVWTGSEMIVWGGFDGVAYFNTGGRYDPGVDSWTGMPATGAPAARSGHTAVWTGCEMIIFGGGDGINYFNDTFSFTFIHTYNYNLNPGAFRITNVVLSGGSLTVSFPTVTGRAYTLWRSDSLAAGTWTNTGFPALAGTGTTLTFTIPAPAAVPERFFRVQAGP